MESLIHLHLHFIYFDINIYSFHKIVFKPCRYLFVICPHRSYVNIFKLRFHNDVSRYCPLITQFLIYNLHIYPFRCLRQITSTIFVGSDVTFESQKFSSDAMDTKAYYLCFKHRQKVGSSHMLQHLCKKLSSLVEQEKGICLLMSQRSRENHLKIQTIVISA